MGNERLRHAMVTAHIDVGAVSAKTGVDPKTVQRWISGRLPHARHRWALAKMLGEREDFLWPQEADESRAEGKAQTAEILAAYGRRADVPAADWWDLLARAQRQIDLLGYAIHFLPEQLPNLSALLREKAESGCRIRIAIGDPDSRRIQERDEEEQLGGTLPARIRSTLHHLRDVRECFGVEIGLHDAPLYNSVFRADDEMYVTPHLFSVHGSKAPLLHLRRLGPNGPFAGFAAHFEAIWETTKPVAVPAVVGQRRRK